jgi:hypothetical protein
VWGDVLGKAITANQNNAVHAFFIYLPQEKTRVNRERGLNNGA